MDDVLTDAMRARLDDLVASERVVLFMKGTPSAPQCGFSARVVELLGGLDVSYRDVDVLADLHLRESMKAYADWPTFPQLWVDGALVGGADIVEELFERGELDTVVGTEPVKAPTITLTDAARERIRGAMEGADLPLRLRVDARFRYQFEEVARPGASDQIVVANGVRLVLDRATARRTDGMIMDYVDGPDGAGLVVDNPNEPARVQQLSVEQLRGWMDDGTPFHLVDVRTDEEWSIARIEGARLLDAEGQAWLETVPHDETLVLQCHHGVRSQHAADHFVGRGFRKVYNLAGGIDAWSARIDPDVPRY